MKNKYLKIASICAVLFLASCSDSSFLDVDSQKNVDADDSEEVYEPVTFVNGVYGMFTDWDYAFSYLGITEIISDNADKGSSSTDTGSDKDILDNLTYTSTDGSIAAMWEHWYKSIGRATTAINYTESYGLTDESYKNRLIGEAKFLRALNYFFLVRGWGAVPIQEQDLVTRASVSDVYAYIESDLLSAIQTLPLKSAYSSSDLGRATKGAAMGLLSKVYLYQENWAKAYAYADSVITSGEYGLESDYSVLWHESSENGTESLFEFQARGESVAHGVQQYSQTQGARGTTGWGWGFNVPSDDMLEVFNDEGDTIRRDATIIFRNSTLWDGRVVGATENPMYNLKAYSSADAGAEDTDKNIRYLRLGEIYLIRAEAANELGNTDQALSDLNTIRERVKLADVTTTDQDELREAIWHERRLELAFEHDRWFDLIRTGQAASVMQALGKPFVEGKHELFPIPNAQLIQTPDMEQNPNW
ncbi:MAG: SusD family [Bacteroidetes bacterium]|jgi:starch-binding outer membrane protein, SusD/RagB family|nr:SusD family [Bacteroidota bacterium]